MQDKRALLKNDNAELTVKAEKENRKLNDDEQKVFDENIKTMEQLEKDILVQKELRKMPEGKKVEMSVKTEKRFSLMKTILNVCDGKPVDSDFIGLLDEGRDEFKRAKVPDGTRGQIILPSQTKSDLIESRSKPESRSAIISTAGGSTTAGGYAVAMDWKTVLPPLTNYLVLAQAGATYLTGLVGNVQIPTYSGTSVYWATEVATATEGEGTWGVVNLYPKRIAGYIDVSKQFLLQDSVGAETMLMNNIAKAVSAKLESTILGTATGSSTTQPAGLFYSIVNTAVTTATYGTVIDLESTVNTANALFGNLAYITSPAGNGKLKQTPKIATYGSEFLIEDGIMNGYPVYVTAGCATTTAFGTTNGTGLVFGNWADLIIGQWGGFDILVDPYTQATKGTVRLVINCYFDAAAERAVGVGFSTKHIAK
jgi:HK97 family phage major capsid protein